MTAPSAATAVSETGLDVRTEGAGSPLLFLHGESGLLFCDALLRRLGKEFTVIAPSHPGWGESTRHATDRTVDDLAYRYLDLLETFDEPAFVLGCGLGAWLALEVATKDETHIAGLTLVSPVGIRTGEPTKRHYLDRYAVSADVVATALYGAPDRGPDLSARTDADLLQLARAQEAAAYYTWQPYLHNPSLLARLHRVRRPVQIITGALDGVILADDHVETLQCALGGATESHVLPDTGHRVEEQRPEELAEHLVRFARDTAAVRP
ncbi:MAG: hypothetical protein QOF92_4789 [Pseudonocardiales bacterium]|jgi:pimeloyl-ACP methyl ester carboxylesterase|nr:hypothetical protein [Pseudonocardiales bacterium]